ncbi:hypothetical protein [Pseudoflavonifractor sp. MSJ-37]|uniref:hypothetical protein n=1 Tax=Pseudoflavonifractor sp. MSJ-37 TaxID=2841531 RepID=UPI001C0F5319|nr:hypothetical protein [Pseudoflavonifractor sp. MSJ-37]MBU5435662.1 hypothetical protein [Pseudoflavonifractor sp. MSJ-37]
MIGGLLRTQSSVQSSHLGSLVLDTICLAEMMKLGEVIRIAALLGDPLLVGVRKILKKRLTNGKRTVTIPLVDLLASENSGSIDKKISFDWESGPSSHAPR